MTAAALLVLASTSRYRSELLARLYRSFGVRSPGVDETSQPGETPVALAERLARAKALAVATAEPGAIVVGSDQVVDLGGVALGKPGAPERARAQLAALSFALAACDDTSPAPADGGATDVAVTNTKS